MEQSPAAGTRGCQQSDGRDRNLSAKSHWNNKESGRKDMSRTGGRAAGRTGVWCEGQESGVRDRSLV